MKKKCVKKKEISKNESKKNSQKEDLIEILDKISVKKKSENSKKSGERTFIDDKLFSDFLQGGKSAPVLEQIAGEQSIGWTRREGQVKEEKGGTFSYDGKQEKKEEVKYDNSYSQFKQETKRVDFEKTGRDIFNPKVHEIGLRKSETSEGVSLMQEKYTEPDKIDINKAGRENPFESKFKKEARKKSDYLIR